MIPLESNSDIMGLAMFILRRLLWNPDIAAQFRHAKVPNLYKDGNLPLAYEGYIHILYFIFSLFVVFCILWI